MDNQDSLKTFILKLPFFGGINSKKRLLKAKSLTQVQSSNRIVRRCTN